MTATCDGCGKPIEEGSRFRGPVCADVEIAPGRTVTVCGSTRSSSTYFADQYSYAPRLPCLRAAFERANACPGCGETQPPGRRGPFNAVCAACRAALERGRVPEFEDVAVYGLDNSLVGGALYLERDDDDGSSADEAATAVLGTIARVAAATGPRRLGHDVTGYGRPLAHGRPDRSSTDSSQPHVDLDAGQRDAVLELAGAIREFGAAMRRQGRREGRDLLGGLARGNLRVSEFEERVVRWDAE